jgi:predicted adenylyl cyclase CyaB
MGFFEIEQKYRLKDPAKVRAILKKIGATRIASGVETNEFYDRDAFFAKQRVALRLRRFGRGPAKLTLKGPRIKKTHFTKRIEIETPVDLAAAKAFLKFLGCRILRQYSKRRELYKYGRTTVTVDFLKKFGWFLEIEGQPRSIQTVQKKLGLRDGDREERSFLQMLFQWKH